MLHDEEARCTGRAPYSVQMCQRKNECARYLAPAGLNGSPFVYSACEGRDGFIHAATVGPLPAPVYPADASSHRAMGANTVPCAVGGKR
jgi:hypothetical protein